MEAILETKKLSHIYSAGTPFERGALLDVDFTAYQGEYLGIIGHTGSGKSTLIQHLNGLLKPTSGQVLFQGTDIWSDPKTTRQTRFQVGLVFQYPEYQLFEETVYQDISFGPKNMGLDEAEVDRRVREAARFVGLRDEQLEKSPFELSGGQKRRVAIAGVIAMEPKVLILDEPTAGLDPVVRDEILDEFLSFICDEDHAILISSHITSDLEKAADYITYLHQGRVALSQPKDELLDRYGRVGCSAADLAAIQPGDLLRVRRGTFGCEGLTADREAFRRKYPGLTVDPATLEDIMLFIGKGESLCAD